MAKLVRRPMSSCVSRFWKAVGELLELGGDGLLTAS